MKRDDTNESGKRNEKFPTKKANKKQKNYKGKNQLSASQLRNARKRRARAAAKTTTSTSSPSASNSHHSQHHQHEQLQQHQQQDPSLRYISKPHQAPIVQRAIQFFAQQQPAISQFPVILSTTTTTGSGDDHNNNDNSNPSLAPSKGNPAAFTNGWRTVAKLAVRANKEGRITIGLFAKGSHDVLDCATSCPAHHPSINRAVQRLQEICRHVHVGRSSSDKLHHSIATTRTTIIIPAYSEQSGQGCFRYVQCQVERATGAVQITLVWRKDPQHDTALKFLCQQIIMSSSSSSSSSSSLQSSSSCASCTAPGVAATAKQNNYSNGGQDGGGDGDGCGFFLLHSLWVHYNNAGKHENSIVSRSASVNTMQCCTVDKLHNMGQDGSWVHIIPARSSSTAAAGSSHDVKDSMNGTFLSGVVVERLDNVLLRKCDSDDDDDNDDDQATTSNDSLSHHRQLLSVPLHFAPNVFRQANLDGFAAIVAKIRSYFQSYLKKHQQQPQQQQQQSINLVELYGGVGTIGLHLADLCTSLVCSDENPYNQACFQAAVNGMQWSSSKDSSSSSSLSSSSSQKKKKQKKHRNSKKEESKNNNNSPPGAAPTMIRYEPQSATAMVQNVSLLRDADWIVVDPPRKGLDEAVIQALCHNHDPNQEREQHQQKQQVLVYVSCGFDAFQRDFGHLTSTGKPWKLQHAEGHILFPGSDAIEVLAFFSR